MQSHGARFQTKASSSSSDVRSVDMKSKPQGKDFFSDAERLKLFFFLPLQFPMLQVLKPVAGCIDVDDWKAGK